MKCRFQVGDIVKVKSWEEMVSQYKVDTDGDIFHGDIWFVKDMRYLCGLTFEVAGITECGGYFEIETYESTDGFTIADWMVELALHRQNMDQFIDQIHTDDFLDLVIQTKG